MTTLSTKAFRYKLWSFRIVFLKSWVIQRLTTLRSALRSFSFIRVSMKYLTMLSVLSITTEKESLRLPLAGFKAIMKEQEAYLALKCVIFWFYNLKKKSLSSIWGWKLIIVFRLPLRCLCSNSSTTEMSWSSWFIVFQIIPSIFWESALKM